MREINKCKEDNSAILLADGFEIGNQNRLTYKELSGLLGNLLSLIRSHRTGWLEADPKRIDQPIPPVPHELMTSAIGGKGPQSMASAQHVNAEEDSETKKDVYYGTTGLEDFIVPDDSEDELE